MNKHDEKALLRQKFKKLRASISPSHSEEAANKAAKLLFSSEIFQKSTRIACYYPFPHEFDVFPIIKMIWQEKKECYLPITLPNRQLNFGLYQNDTLLTKNRYGVLEPNTVNVLVPIELDLVIVPLIAFDSQRYRLGSGGGYYDATFANAKPYLLGLGYEIQRSEGLPHDEWDIVLNGILTEKQFYN